MSGTSNESGNNAFLSLLALNEISCIVIPILFPYTSQLVNLFRGFRALKLLDALVRSGHTAAICFPNMSGEGRSVSL